MATDSTPKKRFEIVKTEDGFYDYFDRENQRFLLETDYGVQGASRIDEEKDGVLRYNVEGVPYIITVESIKLLEEEEEEMVF